MSHALLPVFALFLLPPGLPDGDGPTDGQQATLEVLKEQMTRMREDVRNNSQDSAVLRETLHRLDSVPQQVASLSARVDGMEARANSWIDWLLKSGFGAILGIGGWGAAKRAAGNNLPGWVERRHDRIVQTRPPPAAPGPCDGPV